MDVGTALAGVQVVKGAFLLLTALALTSYKWPVDKPLSDSATCDYIVIGAGTAGSIVANRLSEDPRFTVCVIEAGGDPPLETEIPSLFAYLPKTYMDWNFTSEDDGYTAQYRQQTYLDLPQGKALGGSSSIHHFYHIRGDPKDYDDWATATGDDSWSWQNLIPYFIKSERLEDPYILNSQSSKYHGTNGYMGITRESRDCDNSQDHMAVILVHRLEETSDRLTADPTQFPLPSFVGFGAINKTQSYPDYITLNLISRNSPAALMQLCSSVFSLHENVCAEIYAAGEGREVLFSALSLGRPSSRGQVRLQSTNPEDPPKIYTGFLSAAVDLQNNVDSILDFIKVTESSYFAGVGAQTIYFDFPNCRTATNVRDYWECYVLHMMDTSFHYSSTCPMGTVLDSSLKVVGVSKLRVVDASAMPNLTSGNINAAVVVLAEKAADIIKRSQSCE
nr:choline dehydrogenase, mitochondrial-like [Vanessa tameamea]